jgi:penicillin-binding protein 2
MKNQYAERQYLISALVIILVLIIAIRLFVIQIIDKSYKLSAINNSRREVIQYPARGLIYDRNMKLLVSNQAAYDIMVTPFQVRSFDTITFCNILGIDAEFVRTELKRSAEYSRFAPSVFMKQVPADVSSVFQEQLYKFPGFFVQIRTLRSYTRDIAPHILGYVSEVDKKTIEANPYYQMGDYIGVSGVEKAYEDVLCGVKGKKNFLVDVHNRITGIYEDGKFDTPGKLGNDIVLSIDADLQEYGEKLMKQFSGSIVAIEPSTGEILTLASTPGYTPSLMIGRNVGKNYRELSQDTLLPLFNRALSAGYPPGSTFKLINALIALQEGVIEPSTQFGCQSGYYYRSTRVGCHPHSSPLDLTHSISNSCNAYYCNVLRKILENPVYSNTEKAYEKWREHVTSFGFGQVLGSDLFGELKGFVPEPSYYNRYYTKGRWNFLTVISLSIGQGELGNTPLQMANMTAAIANRGFFYVPHIVKKVKKEGIDKKYIEKHLTSIDQKHFDPIIEGMYLTVNGGAGSTARIAKIPDIDVCGKTGTAQNPFGEDHSIFVAFAPRENPQIAIAVYVENVGYGSTWAAPVASLLIEKYLKGSISRPWLEDHLLAGKTKKQ